MMMTELKAAKEVLSGMSGGVVATPVLCAVSGGLDSMCLLHLLSTWGRERNMAVITHAKKPFTKGINECLTKYNIPAAEAALVGDQIYTDTLGANSAGVTSILVKAIDNHNFWLKARHVLEKPFIFAARKRRI